MYKFKFNNEYMNSILSGNKPLSVQDRLFFTNVINGIYSYPYIISKNKKEKIDFIEKLKIFYDYLGYRFIEVLIKIHDDNIFNINYDKNNEILSLHELSNLVLLNYKKYMPLVPVETFIYDKNPHIHEVDDKNLLSYTYYSSILNDNFIVINPQDGNGILNAQIQESLENIMPLSDDIDLGPTLFRLLFHDLLFEKKDIKYSTDFMELIETMKRDLNDIYPYLKLCLDLNKRKFNLSNNELEDLLKIYFNDKSIEEIINVKIISKVDSIITCLSSIELRSNVGKYNIIDILLNGYDHFCYTETMANNKLLTYKKYVQEINDRIK